MSDADRTALQQLLVGNYDNLNQRLTRRLGSAEAADEALQETYLRLEKASLLAPVRRPVHYLYQIALNIAADRRRAETRRMTAAEIDVVLDLADEAPDPARVAEARSELRALQRVMDEMPERRRAIFRAVLLENVSRRVIAEKYGVSTRTVDIEVQRALEYGARRLQENFGADCEATSPESSTE